MKAKIKDTPFEFDVVPHFVNGLFDGFVTVDSSPARCYFKVGELEFTEVITEEKKKLTRDTRVCDLEISSRLRNCILYSRIFDDKRGDITLGDVVDIPKSEWQKVRNFGAHSMRELEDVVEKNGLEFISKADYWRKNH